MQPLNDTSSNAGRQTREIFIADNPCPESNLATSRGIGPANEIYVNLVYFVPAQFFSHCDSGAPCRTRAGKHDVGHGLYGPRPINLEAGSRTALESPPIFITDEGFHPRP